MDRSRKSGHWSMYWRATGCEPLPCWIGPGWSLNLRVPDFMEQQDIGGPFQKVRSLVNVLEGHGLGTPTLLDRARLVIES